jgi:hypothetical protein
MKPLPMTPTPRRPGVCPSFLAILILASNHSSLRSRHGKKEPEGPTHQRTKAIVSIELRGSFVFGVDKQREYGWPCLLSAQNRVHDHSDANPFASKVHVYRQSAYQGGGQFGVAREPFRYFLRKFNGSDTGGRKGIETGNLSIAGHD